MRSFEDFYNEYHNEYDMVGIIDEMGAKTNVNEFDLTKNILIAMKYTVESMLHGYF